MPKRMLIDSSHPEETRVVVLDGQKVEEFDFEAATKRPLKGNIYLAKVTRVEPSLQAAFVEYGGNRQGFLAFSEIHPDYYQIPVADRMALLAEQQVEAKRRAEEEFESFDSIPPSSDESHSREDASEETGQSETGHTAQGEPSQEEEETPVFENHPEDVVPADALAPADSDEHEQTSPEVQSESGFSESAEHNAPEDEAPDQEEVPHGEYEAPHSEPAEFESTSAEFETGPENSSAAADEPSYENGAGSDETHQPEQSAEAAERPGNAQPLQAQRPSQRWARRRHYKIQEVIKRRQIILVQVVKEERGNKGAALTTYLSLAGRYCVLMPNTPRGGGISRKITNASDRKRLKSAAQALELPEGMGLIIRTAGENRTKVEIKRDYEYLLRMWDTIRELTLKSNAPACVYEEGDLIKRAIRDLYNKDVSEIVVEGDDGYRNAKDFMRMLMPSHAKNVKPYKEPVPLFQRHHIEAQLDAMFSPTVTLRSGGYIVINQTEALVSIDVNSGRATREHSIEDTAYKTNLEAAEEISRQLRLRDLAGLIVIDFIDMEDGRNDRMVEKRLRDSVKNDRARIQIGKISQFGLLEMSRQRLRAGVIAGSTVPCPQCGGQGIVRSVESTALRVLRALDEEGQRQRANGLVVHVSNDVAIYTLNQKRRELSRIETDYGVTIQFEPKEGEMAGTFEIERIGQRAPEERISPRQTPLPEPEAEPELIVEEEFIEEAEDADAEEEEDVRRDQPQHHAEAHRHGDQQQPQHPQGGGRRRRRRRRRGRDRDRPIGAQEGGPAPQFENRNHTSPEFTPPLAPNGGGEAGASNPVPQEFRRDGNGQQNSPPGEGGRRRRRRRRRGHRGPREGMPLGTNDVALERIEGVPVDASVQDPDAMDNSPVHGDTGNTDIGIGIAAPVALPNAPSAPVWSLSPQPAHEHTGSADAKPFAREIAAPEPSRTDAASVSVEASEPPAPKAPDQPVRKGWWQRPFKLRE